MNKLLKCLKDRRIVLKLTQADAARLVGMGRQQYSRLENKGNPRLDTLELLSAGLKGRIMFIPDKSRAGVERVLAGDAAGIAEADKIAEEIPNPWRGYLPENDE